MFVYVSAFTACQITVIKINRKTKRKEIIQKYTVCLLAGIATPAGVSAYFPCPFSLAAVAESFTVKHTHTHKLACGVANYAFTLQINQLSVGPSLHLMHSRRGVGVPGWG